MKRWLACLLLITLHSSTARADDDVRIRRFALVIGANDGGTERVTQGGSLSCAAGPGGGGCFGFAWWQNDAKYEASVWDLDGLEDVGTISADVSGTSFMPAIVIPIPLIARTQSKACKGLATQLKLFIVDDEAV